jgi:lipid II:glycine glycyltransferase (peptidoglycan interpeptide bridge formation enzyme)
MLTATTPTAEQWDAFVEGQPRAHVLQQAAWGELKRQFGWQVERVALTDDSTQIVAGAQILLRPLPFWGKMAYVPLGPYVTSIEQWPVLWEAVDRRVKRIGAAFLKWEPGIYRGEPLPDFERMDFRESPQAIQPPRTILIDISGDEEAILARMNQGTRRKIRQSQKTSIRYFEGSSEDVATFNQMMQKTGARNEFGVHEPRYYQLAYDLFVREGDAALILAEHEGDALAAIMVFAKGRTAWYLYGASSDVKRNLMAAYGVQWQAIQWAKARGCTVYDLWGIPDTEPDVLEAEFEGRSDGLWGVYGFKRGWGGEVARSVGAWDRVYNPVVYAAYLLVLKIRQQSGE